MLPSNRKVPIPVVRDVGLPNLINSKSPSLMPSVQFINKLHVRSIARIQKLKEESKSREVLEFTVDPHSGKIMFKHVKTELIPESDSDMTKSISVLGKRERDDLTSSEFFDVILDAKLGDYQEPNLRR